MRIVSLNLDRQVILGDISSPASGLLLRSMVLVLVESLHPHSALPGARCRECPETAKDGQMIPLENLFSLNAAPVFYGFKLTKLQTSLRHRAELIGGWPGGTGGGRRRIEKYRGKFGARFEGHYIQG